MLKIAIKKLIKIINDKCNFIHAANTVQEDCRELQTTLKD